MKYTTEGSIRINCTKVRTLYILLTYSEDEGVRGGVVIKALRHKPAGRGFDSQWCHWKFSVT